MLTLLARSQMMADVPKRYAETPGGEFGTTQGGTERREFQNNCFLLLLRAKIGVQLILAW